MKIEIDTQRDSQEEIKKAIKLLQSLIGEHAYTNEPSAIRNIFDETPVSAPSEAPSQAASGLFGIFDNPAPASKKRDDSDDGTPPVVEYF